jgi:glucose-1-phosphate adenylyltransferase
MLDHYVTTRWQPVFRAKGRDLSTVRFGAEKNRGPHCGTAIALRDALRFLSACSEDIVVLAADHVYVMDYRAMAEAHRRRDVAATIGVVPCLPRDRHRFGIVREGPNGIVEAYEEKPESLEGLVPPDARPRASMGIYVFTGSKVRPLLEGSEGRRPRDLARDVIPSLATSGELQSFPFVHSDGTPQYWEDIGDLSSYQRCQEAFCDKVSPLLPPELAA